MVIFFFPIFFRKQYSCRIKRTPKRIVTFSYKNMSNVTVPPHPAFHYEFSQLFNQVSLAKW